MSPTWMRVAPGPRANDDAGHLVAERHRRRSEVLLRPRIPALDVDVRAAHARGVDTDEQLARAGLRDRDFADSRARTGRFLDQRAHRRSNRRSVQHCRRLGGHERVVSSAVRADIALSVRERVTFRRASTDRRFGLGPVIHPLLGEG